MVDVNGVFGEEPPVRIPIAVVVRMHEVPDVFVRFGEFASVRRDEPIVEICERSGETRWIEETLADEKPLLVDLEDVQHLNGVQIRTFATRHDASECEAIAADRERCERQARDTYLLRSLQRGDESLTSMRDMSETRTTGLARHVLTTHRCERVPIAALDRAARREPCPDASILQPRRFVRGTFIEESSRAIEIVETEYGRRPDEALVIDLPDEVHVNLAHRAEEDFPEQRKIFATRFDDFDTDVVGIHARRSGEDLYFAFDPKVEHRAAVLTDRFLGGQRRERLSVAADESIDVQPCDADTTVLTLGVREVAC